MKSAIEDVEKFMRAAGQETPDWPQMNETAKLYFGEPFVGGQGVARFVGREQDDEGDQVGPSFHVIGGLVGEEMRELAEAWAKQDDVGVLDGALDTIWTIIAGLRALGFPINAGWIEVALSNHAKIDPSTGVCLKRSDGKILKPLGWAPPDLRGVLRDHGMRALARDGMGRESRRRPRHRRPHA